MHIVKMNKLLYKFTSQITPKITQMSLPQKLVKLDASNQNELVSFMHYNPGQVEHYYKMLESEPTDQYSLIIEKFIILKRRYNKRQVYLPNKKRYLEELDKAFTNLQYLHTTHHNDLFKFKFFSSNPQQYPPNAIRKMMVYSQLNQLKQNQWKFWAQHDYFKVFTLYLIIGLCGYYQWKYL